MRKPTEIQILDCRHQRNQLMITQCREFDSLNLKRDLQFNSCPKITLSQSSRGKTSSSHQNTPYLMTRLLSLSSESKKRSVRPS